MIEWIKKIRNLGVSVVICAVRTPAKLGWLGALAFMAKSVAEIGVYLKEADLSEDVEIVRASEFEETDELAEDEAMAELDEIDASDGSPDEPTTIASSDRVAHDETHLNVLHFFDEDEDDEHEKVYRDDDHYSSESLKNKELEVEYV